MHASDQGYVVRVLRRIGERVAVRLGHGVAFDFCCGRMPRAFARWVVVVAVEFAIGQRRGGEEDAWVGDEELRDHGALGKDAAGGREEDHVDQAC